MAVKEEMGEMGDMGEVLLSRYRKRAAISISKTWATAKGVLRNKAR